MADKPVFEVKKISVIQRVAVDDDEGRKTLRSVGVIIVVLLVISIVFGSYKNKADSFNKDFDVLSATINHNLDEAGEIFDLNPLRARELVTESLEKLSEFESKYGSRSELKDLTVKTSTIGQKILGEYSVSPDVFLDFSLMLPDFRANGASMYKDQIYVFDSGVERIIRSEVEKKRSEIVASKAPVGGVIGIVPKNNGYYYMSESGIHTEKGEKIIDADWGGGSIARFFASNIYVLDNSDSKITRYQGLGTPDAFESGEPWLNNETNVNFQNALSFSVDGYLWVLDEKGSVTKLSQGNRAPFTLKGNQAGGKYAAMYTDDTVSGVYLLDPASSRVVVFDKTGNFVASYASAKFSGTSDILVSEKTARGFVVKEDVLLYFNLDHLKNETLQ